MYINESIVEDAALEWFGELGLGYPVGYLRDTLLPRLLSGELSVANMELLK